MKEVCVIRDFMSGGVYEKVCVIRDFISGGAYEELCCVISSTEKHLWLEVSDD